MDAIVDGIKVVNLVEYSQPSSEEKQKHLRFKVERLSRQSRMRGKGFAAQSNKHI